MEFMDISSLGAAYRYAIKIEQKLKQKTQNLGLGTPHNKSQERVAPTQQNKGQSKDRPPQENQSRPQAKKDTGKTKKDTGKWCDFHKSPWHNTVDFTQSSHWWLR
jgi:hypothetical protein